MEPVAIVGISAEFPSGELLKNLNHVEFFDFLLNKGQAYSSIPSDRFNIEGWKGNNLGQIVAEKGSFLKDLNLFDNVEFGITTKDAQSMALSTRKLIEHSFMSLLDSGIDYRGKNVGCYMSGIAIDPITLSDNDEFEANGSFAGIPCAIANRVSYHLDLLGPSIPVDTACSSSLTALHLAVQAIRAGECEAAVVGGSQINQRIADFALYTRGSILSRDGKCKPFDESADGFARGEGVCVVVLKPLEAALRDGDQIYGSILGTGINSGGSSAPVSAPVAEAQAEAMLRAYRASGRTPAETDFVELHATGTAAGDPTEANWVGEKFQREGEIKVGSVKGNIGHLEITAFLASLSKVCSIFRTGLVPPNVNLVNPNPSIHWEEYKLVAPTEITPLVPRHSSGRALASLCSSGIGGANGHVVVEGPPQRQQPSGFVDNRPVLLVCGGLSPRSASQVAEDINDVIKVEGSDLPIIAAMYGRRSRQLTWRTFSVLSPGSQKLDFPAPRFVPRSKAPVVFVFSGQGPQHFHMGRQLYQAYPAFKKTIDHLDQVHSSIAGYSLVERYGLFAETATATGADLGDTWPISITLPALAMLQMALFDLLSTIGVKPNVVVGHSAGETALLYGSGAGSCEMAMEIAIARGRAMETISGAGGSMAAVNCDPATAQAMINEILEDNPGQILEIACYNSHDAVTLAGPQRLLDLALELANSRGFVARKLRTHIPVHSSMMELCHDVYVEGVEAVFDRYQGTHEPKVATYSSTTGQRWTSDFDGQYFWDNAHQPVMFTDSVSSILRDFPNAQFVELSPHPVLSSYLTELGADNQSVICPMKRSRNYQPFDEVSSLLKMVGQLAVSGHNAVDFSALNDISSLDQDHRLPAYPFARKYVPFMNESSVAAIRRFKTRNGPLHDLDLRINAFTHPELTEHVIRHEPIMPAAGFIEMILELGARVIWNVEFRSMMPIFSDKLLRVNVTVDRHRWSVASSSPKPRHESSSQTSRLHVDGCFSNQAVDDDSEVVDVEGIRKRCRELNMTGFYDTLKYFAQYGPRFRRVTSCYVNGKEALTEVICERDDIPESRNYVMHPAILDACFHVMVHPAFTGNADRNVYYLPSKIGRIVLYQPDFFKGTSPAKVYSHSTFKEWHPDALVFDLEIISAEGKRICTMSGMRVARHTIDYEVRSPEKRFDMEYLPLQFDSAQIDGIERLIAVCPCGSTELDHDCNRGELENLKFTIPVISFHLNEALALQQELAQLRKQDHRSIWIEASLDVDGFAARGFTRSLRKEVFSAEIRLILFDNDWSITERKMYIHHLSNVPSLEWELLVDCEGKLHVPRLVSVPSPDMTSLSTPDNSGNMSLISPASVTKVSGNYVSIRITSVTPAEGDLRGFAGVIQDGGSSAWTIGDAVFGIYEGGLSDHVVVHSGNCAVLPDLQQAEWYASIALPLVIATRALGSGSIRHPERLKDRHVLIVESGPIDIALTKLISTLGAHVSTVSTDSIPDILSLVGSSDFVISGNSDNEIIQIVASALPSRAVSYFWNESGRTLRHTINSDPWTVGDALLNDIACLSPTSLNIDSTLTVDPTTILPSNSPVAPSTLLDSQKAYLLIGGIGSLGLHIAVWMYEHGARHIILTSRSGRQSLHRAGNLAELRMLEYLERQSDLEIQLVPCDAMSYTNMSALTKTIEQQMGGCVFLSAVLSDRLFVSHSQETFDVPFGPKHSAFQILERLIDIPSLDFLVTLSSAIIFGNIGQTNYASANTALDGLTKKYKNAFSVIAPAISDSNMISHNDDLTPDPRFERLMPWSMTSRQLCDCIGDGIQILSQRELWLYVPDLKWNEVQKHLGSASFYDHLIDLPTVDSNNSDVNEDALSAAGKLKEMVLGFVDVSPEDFSPDVPFTSYGLDSLSAGRLSHALKPLISISQLQLLADMCLKDLESLVAEATVSGERTGSQNESDAKLFSWDTLNQSGQTVVKLVDKEETGVPPLILIHGGSGNIIPFMPLQQRFKSALWAIQTTPETPLDSIESMASFYFLKIKEALPFGPYRLGGFSASSLLSFRVAELLEANGDKLVQFVQLDHFPALFYSPIFPVDEETFRTRKPSRKVRDAAVKSMCDCYSREPTASRQKIGLELADAHAGLDVRQYIKDYYGVFDRTLDMTAAFVLDKIGKDEDGLSGVPMREVVKKHMDEWMQKLEAKVTVIIASQGIALSAGDDKVWEDFGCREVISDAQVFWVESAHFEMFERPEIVDLLEGTWNNN